MSIAARFFDRIIWLYQTLSAGRPSPCRYDPSCSVYAREALARHGAGRGLWLTVRRLGRCHPWGGQGHDPVPARHATRTPASPPSTSRT